MSEYVGEYESPEAELAAIEAELAELRGEPETIPTVQSGESYETFTDEDGDEMVTLADISTFAPPEPETVVLTVDTVPRTDKHGRTLTTDQKFAAFFAGASDE